MSTEVERPVLVIVPEVDTSSFSEEQIKNISEVVYAYNTNLALLVNYTNELTEQYELVVSYYKSISESLTK